MHEGYSRTYDAIVLNSNSSNSGNARSNTVFSPPTLSNAFDPQRRKHRQSPAKCHWWSLSLPSLRCSLHKAIKPKAALPHSWACPTLALRVPYRMPPLDTRNMVHKCQHCNQSFAKRWVLLVSLLLSSPHSVSSEELHSHSVQCGATTWDQSTDRMIQAMTQYTPDTGLSHNIEFAGGLGIVGTPIHEHPPGLSDDFINVDLFQQTDPLKADQATHEFQDFFSSISSALSESASSPSTSSEILSASAVSFPFPYPSHTPGTASTNSSNVSSTNSVLLNLCADSILQKSSPSPPSTIFSSGSYSFGVSPEERANSISRWNSYNMMMSLNEANAGEKPMYTQKQVEDMLDMVGNCFLDTIVSYLF